MTPFRLLLVAGIALVSGACERSETHPPPETYRGDVESLPKNIREEKAGIELFLVKPGEFLMGRGPTEEGNANELPRHRVRIVRPYYLGKFEVTVGQFKKFAEATGYVTDAEKRGGASGWDGKRWGRKRGVNWKNPGFSQETAHPVVAISLNDARAFCRWLGEGYRLPSEAEWEYAARAGAETAFSWGTNLQDICLYANGGDASAKKLFPAWKTSACDDGSAWTAPVGSYRPNRWGFYDMSGNAWEWCEDAWHGSFKGAPADQSVWGEVGGGGRRVLKGGSWYFEPQDLRPSWRGTHRAHDATNGAGFRVLKDLGGPADPRKSSGD